MAIVLGGCSSAPPPISVSISPSPSTAIDQSLSVNIKASISNSKVPARGVTWSLSGPGTLSSEGTQSVTYVTPAQGISSPEQATVTATSVVDPTKTASVQITVNPYPVMPNQSLAFGTVGVPYSQSVAVDGGTAPFQWSVYDGPIETGWKVGGSVPDGLTFDPNTGVISGTPTAAGTWYFEATAVDADNALAFNGFMNIQINPASAATGNPVPFLNQPLTPDSVAPGGGDFVLNVSGAGFISGATVDWNGTALATTFVDSEHLSATVPAADVATAMTASVTVVNPAPGGWSSNVVYFQVGAPEATVSFADASNSSISISEPLGLVVADFNGDGKPDLAITANSRLYTVLGKGDGTFAPASGSPTPIPSPPYDDFGTPYVGSMAVGDFNHSGHSGLAVAEWQNEAAVILGGNGDGTFTTSSAAFVDTKGMPTTAVQAADFNADGNLDLALINSISGRSIVALGYGSGAFNTAGTLYTTGFPYTDGFPAGAAVGDFNGDGKLDVAVASGGSPKYPGSGVAVSLGNGDGTFTQAAQSPVSLGQSLSAIVAGDFNGDGKLDLAVTDGAGNSVFILMGNGDGTFQTPITIAVGNGPDAIVAGDFNNDGKLDLAIANYSDNTVTLLLGNGDGTFIPASGSPFAVGNGPLAIVAADFNGDGKLDLGVANAGDGTVSILLQK